MRVVRLQGCLPTLLLLLAVAGVLALALAAGTVFFVAAAALALAGGALRWLTRLGRPRDAPAPRPSVPGAARDAVVEVEATERPPPRLPPDAGPG